jgi:hypothetical protein
MKRSWRLFVFVIAAGLLALFVLPAGCSEPQETEDEFPPPNDAPPS